MPGREHLAVAGFAQDPLGALVAGSPQVGGHAGPVEVHVHRDRGGGRVVCEPALQLEYLVEAEPGSAELLGNGDVQVARAAELLEVLVEEPVVLVVLGRSLVEAGEHVVGEYLVGLRDGHGSPSPNGLHAAQATDQSPSRLPRQFGDNRSPGLPVKQPEVGSEAQMG